MTNMNWEIGGLKFCAFPYFSAKFFLGYRGFKFLFASNPYETINTPIPVTVNINAMYFDPIDRSVEYVDHSEHTQKALACDSQSLANFLA